MPWIKKFNTQLQAGSHQHSQEKSRHVEDTRLLDIQEEWLKRKKLIAASCARRWQSTRRAVKVFAFQLASVGSGTLVHITGLRVSACARVCESSLRLRVPPLVATEVPAQWMNSEVAE